MSSQSARVGPRRSDRQSQPSLKAIERSNMEFLTKLIKHVEEQFKRQRLVKRELDSQPKAQRMETLLNEIAKGMDTVLSLYQN